MRRGIPEFTEGEGIPRGAHWSSVLADGLENPLIRAKAGVAKSVDAGDSLKILSDLAQDPSYLLLRRLSEP